MVGLVKAEKVLAARRKSRIDCRRPARGTLGSPQHRNVLDVGREGASGSHVPVVCPSHTAVSGYDRNQADVVVGGTLLARRRALPVEPSMPPVWGSEGSPSHEESDKEVDDRHHVAEKIVWLGVEVCPLCLWREGCLQ